MGNSIRKHLVAVAVALALLVGLPVGTQSAAADEATSNEMLALHNQLRFAIGAPTITADPRVVAAAQAHANYSTLNRVGGHTETPGLPGFTGVSARDRVAAQGLSAAFVSEVATGGSGGALAGVRQLWDAPYHRLGMMHPNAVSTGWGYTGTTVGNFIYNFGIRPIEFVRSPANGQVGIPTSWSGRESPNPLPAGVSGPVGYPIMVVYSAAQNVVMRAAEIVAPGGVRLPIYYAPQQFEYDYQVIVPQKPLPAGTTLHVRFDITVNGVWVTNEWDFTTAGAGTTTPVTPVVQIPPAANVGFHSQWVSESAFPTLAQGQTSAPLSVTFKNTGTEPWVKGVLGKQANLGINGDNRSFAMFGANWPTPDRVAVQTESVVQPGGTGTFTFTVRGSAPGTYPIHLRPVIDGTTWMEDEGVYLVITVR